MVSLTCSTIRDGGVTLVTAQVTNSDRRRRVRLRHDADGPVWPPRSEGVPVEGWDGDTFECVLAADERRAVGYATPAPVEDPLAVAATEPVDADPADGAPTADLTPAVTPTPDGVVRALGPPEPPRDAVPDPESVDAGDSTPTDPATERATDGSATARSAGSGDAAPSFAAADAWFSSVERRLDAAESLSGTTAVSAATPAVRRLGGLDGVRETAAELDTDAERLRRLAARATDLADRAESASLPVETLDRLA
jgi:hypothetical protein